MVFANSPVTVTSRVPMVTMAVTAGSVGAVAVTAVSVGAVAVTASGAVLLPLALTMLFCYMLAVLTEAGAGKFPVPSPMLAPTSTAGRGRCICHGRSARQHGGGGRGGRPTAVGGVRGG